MSMRTLIVLFFAVFNSLWLAHAFGVLYLQGYYPITESVRWVAFGEMVLCLAVAGLGIERLLNIRERHWRERL